MKVKPAFLVVISALIIWFLFIERAILPPFILAAIFAYIFNPIVTLISKRLYLPRTFGSIFIYSILLAILVLTGAMLTKRIAVESLDLTKLTRSFINNAQHQAESLPDWLEPVANDFLIALKKSQLFNFSQAQNTLPLFSQAISRVISFFIFLFSGFYFLKDGPKFIEQILAIVPNKHKIEIEILLRKVNAVLSGYLRGQLLLIFLMSLALYIALSILGIRFALTIAIFSGFAEIVPVIGPITAGAVAVFVAFFTGTANFGLQPIHAALIIIGIYFILRQLEDYLVIPHVMEKITKLPPFIIFFAVIAGGHIAGILGLILAVPIAAIMRLLIEFSFDKLHA